MNASLMILEIAVVLLGLGVLLLDLWTPAEKKRELGLYAAVVVAGILGGSFLIDAGADPRYAFGGMYVQDGLSLFFKRLFLFSMVIVLVMSTEVVHRIKSGISEYCALTLFAGAGMMMAASSNNLAMLFVSIELITVTFYVLVSIQRSQTRALEAGVKYLIIGALSSAVMVYGIALVFGISGEMTFIAFGTDGALDAKNCLAGLSGQYAGNPLFLAGVLFILFGLAFKVAAFPFQLWAPDVYHGALAPTSAFLAVGSKAAGFALMLRVLFHAFPEIAVEWSTMLAALAGITILYGNLGAIPQRNLKRLMGYSSIAHAGYVMMGVAAVSAAGQSATLCYLGGYTFTALAAFGVIAIVSRSVGDDDISSLAGLSRRSPFLAASLTLAMVSLTGLPPLAGFFGKFMLLKAAVEASAANTAFYWLIAAAVFGVIVSVYYYFNVIRVIYFSSSEGDDSEIEVSQPMKLVLILCVAGMLVLGLYPNAVVDLTVSAVRVFTF